MTALLAAPPAATRGPGARRRRQHELRRQIGPHLTPDAIEQLLESTGRPIVDSRNGVTTPRLDLFAAVMKLRQDTKPATGRQHGSALTATFLPRV